MSNSLFFPEQTVSCSSIQCVKSINPIQSFLMVKSENFQLHHSWMFSIGSIHLLHTTTTLRQGTTTAARSAIAGTFRRRSSQRYSLGHQGHGYRVGPTRTGTFISGKSHKLLEIALKKKRHINPGLIIKRTPGLLIGGER